MLMHHNINEGGGDVARVKKIANLLSGSFEVEIVGFGYSPMRLYLIPFWMAKVARAVIRKNWDFVYIYNQRYLVIFAWLLKRCLDKKYKLIYDAVLTWKVLSHSGFYKAFRGRIEKIAGKCADGVVGVSKLSGDYFGDKTLLIVPTLVDTDMFRRNVDERKTIRKFYGFKKTDKVVGLVGSFGNEYNRPQLEFLRDNINRFDKRIKFMVIGRVENWQWIPNKRITYTNFVEDYAGHLSVLDALLVIRTIPTDGAINRIVEAMSMKLPVFANPVAEETMDWGIAGIDFIVADDWDLPDRINRRLFDRGLMERIGVCARRVVGGHYSEAMYREKIAETLAKC